MTETRELRSVMNEAQQAANAGDYAAAEPLLREAAVLQEAGLGPLHPDLANTLNNLAVVCELTGKMGEAEEFYRRAYAIASAVLAPGDELRATSERNLRDFCEARGRPVQLPTQLPAAAPERESPSASAPIDRPTPPVAPRSVIAPPPVVAPPPLVAPPRIVSQPSVDEQASVDEPVESNHARPLQLGMLGAAALLLTFTAAYFWVRADAPEESSSTASPPAAVQQAPATPQPSAPVTSAPAPPAPAASSSSTAERKSPAPRTAPAAGVPAIVEAQLCRSLSRGATWRCDPVISPADPGRLFFYTRLKPASGTTVHHRWYRGERLIQAVDLKIQPNGSGFRTYSQQTVTAGSGDWRVELAAANGDILQEMRFAVR